MVALSTKKVEYIATNHASKEAVWMHQLCTNIGFGEQVIRLVCDGQSEILLAKNPTYHSKTKHIGVQYHFVREMIEQDNLLLKKVEIVKNTIDLLTKLISTKKFTWCRSEMGLTTLSN